MATYYVNLGSYAFLAALMEKRGRGAAVREESTSLVMPAGLMEGFETVVLVSAMLAFRAQPPLWLDLTAVLAAVTAGQRAWWATSGALFATSLLAAQLWRRRAARRVASGTETT